MMDLGPKLLTDSYVVVKTVDEVLNTERSVLQG